MSRATPPRDAIITVAATYVISTPCSTFWWMPIRLGWHYHRSSLMNKRRSGEYHYRQRELHDSGQGS
jgi:hypothetical protein